MCILPQMASETMATSKQPRRSFDLRFETSNPDYPGIHVHIVSNGLRGHGGLQTTSEVIWPQIWNQQPWLPWYPCAYCLQWPPRPWRAPSWWPLRLPMTSEVTSDLEFELLDLKNLCSHVYLASNCHYSQNIVGRRRRPNMIHWLRVFNQSKKGLKVIHDLNQTHDSSMH